MKNLRLLRIRSVGPALLWAISAGFMLGVFVRSVLVLPEFVAFALGGIALACVIAAMMDTKRAKLGIVVASALVACGLGIVRMQNSILVGDPAIDSHIGTKMTLAGIVSDEPDARATQVRVPVRILSAASTTLQSTVTILAIFPAHTDIYYGEHVTIFGTLQLPKSFDAGAGRQFNYPGYLAVQGIQYELDRAGLKHGTGFEGNPFIAFSYRIKELFVSGLELSLPEPQSGLAGGITVGDKRAMGKDLSQEFRTVSLIHIVVLSGYNITVVISALFRVLARAPRFVRFGAGGFVAVFFAVMTGFASASLRAALMALIAISGTLSGRIYRADRALMIVAAGMVAWNPYLLVYDPGFQLSFLATAGLMAFSPIFSKWYSRVPETAGLRDILISTSSAQIAVLPLLLYESGNLSLVSIPANLLVLSAVPPAMLASAIAALAGLFAGPAAPFIGFPAYALLSYVLYVAHVLAGIPFASVMIPAFSAWLLLPIYIGLFAYAYVQNSNIQKQKAA